MESQIKGFTAEEYIHLAGYDAVRQFGREVHRRRLEAEKLTADASDAKH